MKSFEQYYDYEVDTDTNKLPPDKIVCKSNIVTLPKRKQKTKKMKPFSWKGIR